MSRIVTTAPGKIVLCGEYAVLGGASGLSMAVDRRARVSMTRIPGDTSQLETSGFGEAAFRAHPDGSITWQGDADVSRLGLFERVWRITPSRPQGAWSIDLDTAAFSDPESRQKLGFGSSAAVAVSLALALSGLTGDTADAAETAQDAHRRFQAGKGSGIDIATSATGGVIEFRPREHPRAQALGWPRGLDYALLWSGRASGTADKLGSFRPGSAAQDLGVASGKVIGRWRDGDVPKLLGAIRDYVDVLERFDAGQSLGIFEAGHRALVDMARSGGQIYKPCGAGGGDVGIVLSDDHNKVRGFVREAELAGFSRLDVVLELRGARVEELERD